MSKELETLESIKRKYIQAISKTKFPRFTEYEQEQFDTIETALKENEYLKTELLGQSQELKVKSEALEIIKTKEIDVCLFNECPNLDEYNNWASDKAQLNKEEYDLLKEVLKDDNF